MRIKQQIKELSPKELLHKRYQDYIGKVIREYEENKKHRTDTKRNRIKEVTE